MLPIVTTGQVNKGFNYGDLIIDLSDYAKKKDTVSKTELESLTSVVANKLDIEPQHKHHIDDIKQLAAALDGKYDTSKKYSYTTILSDSQKISYLESPKLGTMELVKNAESDGYKFYVDEGSGDLMIVLDDILIGTYSKSTHNWSFGGLNMDSLVDGNLLMSEISSHDSRVQELETQVAEMNTKIASVQAQLSEVNTSLVNYMLKTDAVLQNHYDALLMLCQKHELIDNNTTDGSNITPA